MQTVFKIKELVSKKQTDSAMCRVVCVQKYPFRSIH